jgi:uncharacterized protein YbaR (Trm112 family)
MGADAPRMRMGARLRRANEHRPVGTAVTMAGLCYEALVSELPKSMVEILVCAKSKAKLIYFPRGEANDDPSHGFLLCPTSRLRYRIEAGFPVMLVEEAQEVPSSEVERLGARARELRIA